jgi:DNA excision repair protein ERCC-2
LEVFLATGIDTRYRQRAASLPALAEVLQQWLRREPGNCIVYFPSYQYLGDAVEALRQREVAIGGSTCGPVTPGATGGRSPSDRCWWVQESQASKETQETLFQMLRQRREVAAFCILGGIFGEAIDLPGEQLASVIVVGVGLPQVNRDRERLRGWHQARGVDGFAHAYLYPGMQKVDQALGRVVRRMDDRGRALLVDSRYRQAEYLDLLPPWWTYRPWE